MSQIFDWLNIYSHTIVESLLHSLWISTLIGLLVWMLLKILPARRASLRYGVCVGGLLLCVVSTFATWSALQIGQGSNLVASVPVGDIASSSIRPNDQQLRVDESPVETDDDRAHTLSQPISVSPGNSTAARSPSEPSGFTWQSSSTWLLFAWLAGTAFMLLRTLNSLLAVRVVQTPSSSPANTSALASLQSMANELCQRMKMSKPVRLIIGDLATGPAVLGFFKPVILIPPAMLTGIRADHWELILAHELAHVRRYDALVNFMQMLIESVLFFNPAVWWLSRQVRSEREACCDSVASGVTGKSLEFARVLLNVASGAWQVPPDMNQTQEAVNADEKSVLNTTQTPTDVASQLKLAMSFAEETRPGSLRDRVTRLAEPNRPTAPRFTRFGVITAFIAAIVAAVVLQQGTNYAVDQVADLLSPADRVEKLARFQAESTGVFVKPADGKQAAEANSSDASSQANPNPTEKFDVLITVRTADGKPLPKNLLLRRRYTSRVGNFARSGSDAVGSTSEEMAVYKKTVRFPQCRFALSAIAPGYAPAFVAGRTIASAEDAKPIELILQKGFDSTITILGPDKQPVEDADVNASLIAGTSDVYTGSSKAISDKQGTITLSNCAEGTYRLNIKSPGFQRDAHIVEITKGDTATIALTPARPTNLNVVDANSGQPIQGAICAEQCRSNANMTMIGNDPRSDPKYRDVHAISNEQGQLILNELNDDLNYTMAIVADGYGIAGIYGLRAGDPAQTIRLSKPITISGRITKGLERLSKRGRKKQRVLSFENPLGGAADSNADLLHVPVADDGTFEIPDVAAGMIEFLLPGVLKSRTVHVEESIRDLELQIPDVAPKKTPQPTAVEKARTAGIAIREVKFHLSSPNNKTLARGNIYVSWYLPQQKGIRENNRLIPIVKNLATIKAPVGAQLRFEPNNLVGLFANNDDQTAVVEEGSGPQRIEIAAFPAGAVHGTLVDSKGHSVSGFATVLPADESWQTSWGEDAPRLNSSTGHGGGRFFRTLPFDHRYVVVARSQNQLWGVSDPFEINGAHPIHSLQLKLNPGKTVKARILNAAGLPIKKTPINLRVSQWCETTQKPTSFNIESLTDSDGRIEWKHAMPPAKGPVTYSATILLKNIPGHRNRFAKLGDIEPNDGIYRVKLEAATTARGILIDAATGRAVPNAAVRIYPVDFSQAEFRGSVETKTDVEGKFEFTTLEPIEYRGHVNGAAIKGTKITLKPSGGYTLSPPPDGSQLTLDAASNQLHRWQVELIPGQGLAP